MKKKPARKVGSFLAEHSLSIVTILVVLLLAAAYSQSDSDTHWGAFFGNATADWAGLAVFVIITKYFYE
ncbi:MAG TPA: hypothetical protein VMZ25_11050, partial [Terriglobales bacterium]|nr:hypothetical protein [Terriglobales bacterium]